MEAHAFFSSDQQALAPDALGLTVCLFSRRARVVHDKPHWQEQLLSFALGLHGYVIAQLARTRGLRIELAGFNLRSCWQLCSHLGTCIAAGLAALGVPFKHAMIASL
eukprot:2905890-Amphidinium_carterae.1